MAEINNSNSGGFLLKIMRCCSTKAKKPHNQPRQAVVQNTQNIINSARSQAAQVHPAAAEEEVPQQQRLGASLRSNIYQPDEILNQQTVVVSNVIIKSQYNIDDIDFTDFYPAQKQEQLKYKYYCPICLRYFNLILQSGCCQNYICHCCVNDLQEQERKDAKFKAVCPFGCSHTGGVSNNKFVIVDVDSAERVKKYSDSQKESLGAFKLDNQSNQEKDEWFSQGSPEEQQDALSPAVTAVLGLNKMKKVGMAKSYKIGGVSGLNVNPFRNGRNTMNLNPVEFRSQEIDGDQLNRTFEDNIDNSKNKFTSVDQRGNGIGEISIHDESEDIQPFERFQIQGEIVEVADELLESSRMQVPSMSRGNSILMMDPSGEGRPTQIRRINQNVQEESPPQIIAINSIEGSPYEII